MQEVVFIGDELTATGFRLAGATAVIVPPEEAAGALRSALEEASLVLLAASHARCVSASELNAALTSTHPITVLVDDILEREPPPDMDRLMHRALGVEVS
jgi:vacuolar-type H+-ATPase subunit F/Vma7